MLRSCALTIALSVLVSAGSALAQDSTSKYPPPCDPSQVTKADVDRAHSVFLSGKEFLEESSYDKAIGYFEDAYAIDCSVHAILPIIATAYERKGDKAEAIRALEEYLKRAPNAADREIIEHRIKNLKDQLAHESPAAPATSAAGAADTNAAAPPARSPSASSSAAAPPAPAAPPPPESSAAASVSPPPSASTAPAPQAVAERQPTHGPGPWVVVGAGAAALATGIVLYSAGSKDISNALANCPNRQCTAANDSWIAPGNRGRTLENVGGIVGGVGLAATVAGLLWHFVETPKPSSRSGAVQPILAPGYLGAAGSF